MGSNFIGFMYLISSVCFILALRGLSSPTTARQGNLYGMVGMGLAILATLIHPNILGFKTIFFGILIGGIIGSLIATRIQMTQLPQLVAGFHSLVGLAAVFVATASFYSPELYGINGPDGIYASSLIEMGLGTFIGAVTFTGSIIAFAKLHGLMDGKPILLPQRHAINIGIGLSAVFVLMLLAGFELSLAFWVLVFLGFALGILLIIPIGGADMPVVISMLNSYSGWAACGIGLTLGNTLLIITGALVGSSGAILSYIMCKGMNRSFISVILGGFGEAVEIADDGEQKIAKQGSAEDAAFFMSNAQKVIIVPGYGMAVAQAQHALKELAEKLIQSGVEVKFAIHPVAGRMPGHMNVLLAEAQVDYEHVFELEDINRDFSQADVAFVIGANDVTNPAAKNDPASPIYGMPILNVDEAKTVYFVKRSLGSGYAGIDNQLFYHENTQMLLADAKDMCEQIVKHL